MSTARFGFQKLRCMRQPPKSQLQIQQWTGLLASQTSRRNLTTEQRQPNATKSDPFNRLAAANNETGFSPEVIAASGIRPPPKRPFPEDLDARPVPTTPSYFTRQPYFNDALIKITKLFKKYEHLPVAPPERVKPQLWKDIKEYKATCGEPLKGLPFSQLITMVKRLHQIEPDLMPEEVTESLREFKRDVDPYTNVARTIPIDRFGRAVGTGRRKTSTARAWVVEGDGEVQVNGKPLSEAFGRVHDRESALWALHVTERVDKYNVWALVEGGGTTGQAEALTLAISKALIAHEPGLKPALRQAGCITRDPRQVERKKHGHLKARKMPAWNRR